MANRKQKIAGSKGIKTGTWLILIIVFIGELLAYTWCRVHYVQVGYEIVNETNLNQELKDLEGELKVALAHLKSPERFSNIAKDFGLETPSPQQKVTLP